MAIYCSMPLDTYTRYIMEAPGYQLRVREQPSYLSEVTGFIRDGQVIDIIQEKGVWVRLAPSTVDDLKETASFSDSKEYWTARVTGDGVMLKKLIDQDVDIAERCTREDMSAEEKLQGLRDLYPEFTLSELSGVLQKNNYELGPAYYDCQSLKEMDFCEGRAEREMRASSITERKQAAEQTARAGWTEDSPKSRRDPRFIDCDVARQSDEASTSGSRGMPPTWCGWKTMQGSASFRPSNARKIPPIEFAARLPCTSREENNIDQILKAVNNPRTPLNRALFGQRQDPSGGSCSALGTNTWTRGRDTIRSDRQIDPLIGAGQLTELPHRSRKESPRRGHAPSRKSMARKPRYFPDSPPPSPLPEEWARSGDASQRNDVQSPLRHSRRSPSELTEHSSLPNFESLKAPDSPPLTPSARHLTNRCCNPSLKKAQLQRVLWNNPDFSKHQCGSQGYQMLPEQSIPDHVAPNSKQLGHG